MRTPNKRVSRDLDIPAICKPGDCPVEEWLAFLGHRWNALLLWRLSASPKRHGELITLLSGISQKNIGRVFDRACAAWLDRKVTVGYFPSNGQLCVERARCCDS